MREEDECRENCDGDGNTSGVGCDFPGKCRGLMPGDFRTRLGHFRG